MRTAADLISADPPGVTPEGRGRAAIDLMSKTGPGAIPLVDDVE